MFSNITRHQRSANEVATEATLNVMVIDDDPAITSEVATLLSTAGYKAIRCHTCVEAMESLCSLTPDLIIADINLAGHSGVELCQQLRLQPGTSDVPCLFLSGAQTPDIIRRSDEAGGAYYVRKPFDSDVLLELVRKAMRLPEIAASPSVALA